MNDPPNHPPRGASGPRPEVARRGASPNRAAASGAAAGTRARAARADRALAGDAARAPGRPAGRRRRLVALVAALLLPAAGCGGRSLANPVKLTLVNRSGAIVTGALLRFDREIARVDQITPQGFEEARLRVDPADTLRLTGGSLDAAQAVTYELTGRGGPPRVVEARWLVDDEVGPRITEQEILLD